MSDFRAPRNDAEARAYVAQNFGWMAGFLNDPEVGPILLQAGYEKWDGTRVNAALQGTNWWRSQSESQRKYAMAEQSDPAELDRQINAKQATLWDIAANMGVSGVDIGELSRNAVRFGWTDDQVRDQLSSYINASALSGQNMVRTLADQARDLGAQYFVKTDDEQALNFGRRIAAGEMKAEDMQAYYRDRAKELYSHLGSVIDQGVTLKQYFAPHKAEIAKLLEVSEDSIDLMNDPKWGEVLRRQNDDGTMRAATLTEVADMARKDEKWRNTQNAQDGAAGMAMTLAKTFGAI